MKALDTSVLIGLLEGDPGVHALLKRLRGVELAATETNLLELTQIACRGPKRSRAARRAALERLRRKITVLPINGRATEEVGRHLLKAEIRVLPHVLEMLGALEANGCDEVFTMDAPHAWGRWRFKVTRVKRKDTKTGR